MNKVESPHGRYSIVPSDVPNEGILFVDHAVHGRSGHGGNCITQCQNGDILSFYSNVDGEIWRGHSVAGWSEYKISTDGGRTWSAPIPLDYSQAVWQNDEFYSALVFAAVTAPNGSVIVFVMRFAHEQWIKQAAPVVLLSRDHGRTWEGPREIEPHASVEDIALTFDSCFVHQDQVFTVFFGDSANMGSGPYTLYFSADNGETFSRRSTLPFDPANYYCTAAVLENGAFIVYSYPYRGQHTDEHHMHYVVSHDEGRTWSNVQTSFFAKRIRNPQMSCRIGGLYFLHGRSGSYGSDPGNFVLYTSTDGIHWDDGVILHRAITGSDAYSGNAVIRSSDPQGFPKLLIQSSIGYDPETAQVNERQWWIEVMPESGKPTGE